MELYLYQGTKLYEDKNFLVDNGSGVSAIESYLSTISGTNVKHFDNAQYLKDTGLDTEVKIALDQSYLEFSLNSNWNYCKIKNTEGWRYFYVRDIQWVSKGCLKLILHCDVLNTYQGKYDLDKRTTIVREHKDRFNYKASGKAETIIYDVNKEDCKAVSASGMNYYVTDLIPISMANYRTIIFNFTSVGTDTLDISKLDGTDAIRFAIYKHGDHTTLPNFTSAHIVIDASATSTRVVRRNIDRVPEGINPILIDKDTVQDLYTQSVEDENWYLVYPNNEDKLYLAQDKDFYVSALASGNLIEIRASDLTNGRYYYIDFATEDVATPTPSDTSTYQPTIYVCSDNNPNNYIEGYYAGYTGKSKPSKKGTGYTYHARLLRYWRDGDNIKMDWVNYKSNDVVRAWSSASTGGERTINTHFFLSAAENFVIYYVTSKIVSRTAIRGGDTIDKVVNTSEGNVHSVHTFNQENIFKIIEIPYPPVYMKKLSNGYEVQDLIYKGGDTQTLEIPKDVDLSYVLHITSAPVDPCLPADESVVLNPEYSDTRDDDNETKMYYSEFYQPKINYDSFSKVYQLENYKQQEYSDLSGLSIRMDLTKHATSNMLFTFPNYITAIKNEDYDNLLFVKRNNEIGIVNEKYQQYIMNGYNFDQKAQALAVGKGIIDMGAQAVAGGIAGGSKGGMAGAIAGAATGALRGAYGVAQTVINNDLQMKQKLQQARFQGVSIQACDDVELMNVYAHNKLQYRIYTPEDVVKSQILDLFYYCGYNCGYQGVPNTTSRTWFNFVQCEPVFNNVTFRMSADLKNELINKYNQGVTVIHNVNNNYDFEQVKENWETFLLN